MLMGTYESTKDNVIEPPGRFLVLIHTLVTHPQDLFIRLENIVLNNVKPNSLESTDVIGATLFRDS